MKEEKTSATEDVCACCRRKDKPREAGEQRKLNNRINRIIGQLNGIQTMIEDNRYCGDILIQIGAVESALQSLGYVILEEHMQTCVADGVRQGDTQILSEAVELMKKLK
ncbi:MAG: metal-sensing transcriptional repressor [Lachnospiraceae bacterium]|nr:metal-sensing transcriptional repressor [Lachnospiraceae bacterium]